MCAGITNIVRSYTRDRLGREQIGRLLNLLHWKIIANYKYFLVFIIQKGFNVSLDEKEIIWHLILIFGSTQFRAFNIFEILG